MRRARRAAPAASSTVNRSAGVVVEVVRDEPVASVAWDRGLRVLAEEPLADVAPVAMRDRRDR